MFQLLFRQSIGFEGEYDVCKNILSDHIVHFRHQIKPNSVVVGRYSVLPFYKELDDEVNALGGQLINSYSQHLYIANMKDWASDLAHLTPKTYFLSDLIFGYRDIPDFEHGYFVKGVTNSKKHLWHTHARAKTKNDLSRIVGNLMDDLYIQGQEIAIRQFVPLESIDDCSATGLPFSNEWRFFFIGTQLLCYGFYWSIADENKFPSFDPEALKIAQEAATIASQSTNAFCVDVGRTIDGSWIVIELNDLQMSGLSCIRPELFYSRLKEVLDK